ncbi:hypothetical protein RB195_024578 [Necator americanus]
METSQVHTTIPKSTGDNMGCNKRHDPSFLHRSHKPQSYKKSRKEINSSNIRSLGWLISLLHPTKLFLQDLWKQQYDWDTQLPREKEEEWHNIISLISGFQKNLSRSPAPKGCTSLLVAFAHASSNTMACDTCARTIRGYLLMAKSKFPSIQAHYTMPKMELNALTLAMRLAHSVLSQLKSVTNIQGIQVFTDSEIVLKWLQIKPGKEVGQFIHNRLMEVRKIDNNITEQNISVPYGYVASHENPADCET